MKHNILIVDDDFEVGQRYQSVLHAAGLFSAELCITPKDALALLKTKSNKFSIILVDYLMEPVNGAELTQLILKEYPHHLIAILSGDQTREAIKNCFTAGAQAFLDKGDSDRIFLESVKALAKKVEETSQTFSDDESKDENEISINSVGMVGRSIQLAALSETIKMFAPSNSNVVIEGETGSGKELVAKALHQISNRKSKPFVAINVGTVPNELFESELFGHRKGSFTGAITDKIGKFKLAHGGTLFLDEIGDLKKDHQVKLLRVLQEGEFNPVGANTPEKADVRVIVASHANLEKLVKSGQFREDLFYRLNILKVNVPSLRERTSDIRPLVAFFQKKYGFTSKSFLIKTIKILEAYKWPGNVRELDAEMQKLAVLVKGDRIEPSHLDAKFFLEENLTDLGSKFRCYSELDGHYRELEKTLIHSVYNRVRSLKKTSEQLGIAYSTLKLKVKTLNIDLEEGAYEETV